MDFVRGCRRVMRGAWAMAVTLVGLCLCAPAAHARDGIWPIANLGGGVLIQEDYLSGSFHGTAGVTYFREVVEREAVGYALTAEVGYAHLTPAEDRPGHFGELRLGVGYGHVWVYGLFEQRLLLGNYDGFAVGLQTMASIHGVFDILRIGVGHIYLASVERDETRHGAVLTFEFNPMGLFNMFVLSGALMR